MPRTEVFNRDTVLEQAKNIFWSKGYNGTSMQDLVDVTGLNRSSIYNSFGSKMALYELAIKKYQGEGKLMRESVVCETKNGFGTIEALFQLALLQIKNDKEGKGCMLINCSTEIGSQYATLRKKMMQNQEEFVAYFEDLVIKGQADGSIKNSSESKELAYFLMSLFQGLKITGMNTTHIEILKSIIENTLKTIK